MSEIISEAFVAVGVTGLASVFTQLDGLKGAVSKAFSSGFAAVVGAGSITAIFGKAISNAIKAEDRISELRATLQATGNNVEEGERKFNDLATSINNVTNVSKGEIKALAESGLNMGLNIDQAAEYTKAAIGLARATGNDATEAMHALVKAGNGNTMALQRMIPSLANAKNQHEVLAGAMKLGAVGMKEQEAGAGTLSGHWEHLHQTVNGLLTKLGTVFLPIIDAVINGFQDLVDTIFGTNAATDALGKDGTKNMSAIGDAASFMAEYIKTAVFLIKGAFNWLRYEWAELGNSFKIVVNAIAITGSTLWDILKNLFMNAVDITRWFFDNWKNIFTDIGNFASTVFKNLTSNIISCVSRAWKWIKGDKSPNDALKGLADGYVSQTKALPKLRGLLDQSDLTKTLIEDGGKLFEQRDKDAEQFQSNEIKRLDAIKNKRIHDSELAEHFNLAAIHNSKSDTKSEGGFSSLVDIWKNAQTAAMKAEDQTAVKQLKTSEQQFAEAREQTKLLKQLAMGADKRWGPSVVM